MNPLHERLNDRLEQAESRTRQAGLSGFISPEPGLERNAEVDELVALVGRLQAAHQLQVNADFARQLERRMVRRHAELQRKQTNANRSGFSLFRAHPAFGAMLGLCLLFLLLSTGILALASQASNLENPFYAIKRWEQHLQISLASSAGDQALSRIGF